MDINPASLWHVPEFAGKFGGFMVPNETSMRTITNLEPWDSVRRDMLILLLRSLVERGIPGDMAELGVYKGYTAKLLHYYLPEKILHLYDTFDGFDQGDLACELLETGKVDTPAHFSDTSAPSVIRYISPRNQNVRIYQGLLPDSMPSELSSTRYSFIHLDADLYAPTMAGLNFFYPRVESGGFIVVHDFNAWPGARKAVEGFFRNKPELPLPMPDKSGSVVITKLPN